MPITTVLWHKDGTQGPATKQQANLWSGRNAYIHILEAFSMDRKVFDLYLQSGHFELGF